MDRSLRILTKSDMLLNLVKGDVSCVNTSLKYKLFLIYQGGMMNLQEEIAKVARELYEKSGRIEGRDRENWLDAERIVLSRHASQNVEEPEGEEALIADETIAQEVEGTELKQASQEDAEGTTVMEVVEVGGPFIAKKKASRITEASQRIKPAKQVSSEKKNAAKRRETTKKKKK